MSIEPSLASVVGLHDLVVTDWSAYRACPICRSQPGLACEAMYARVENGHPTGERKELRIAHGARHRRSGR